MLTDLGERSDYDAASQCSRCGYCEQSCPTYVATGRESFSPRGRVQTLRLMIEGKLDDPASAEEALASCLLCGACTTACYAHVSVPDLVLEGRRRLNGRPHWLLRAVVRMLISYPRTLRALLKSGFLMKRIGISRLSRPLLRAMGLSVLAEMDEHVSQAPWQFFDDKIKKLSARGEGGAWRYFSACGPRYLYPDVGAATWRVLTHFKGAGRFMGNSCCGLVANNYGEIESARELAMINIAKAEATGEAPILGDCSSCVAFLKSYPQLFLMPSQAEWRARAEAFSSRIRDVAEIYAESTETMPLSAETGRVTYHDSCRALNGQNIKDQPRQAVKASCPEGFREMDGASACCGGAGAFAFVQGELSDQILREKIGNVASAQAGVVVTSSTSCLIQLARGLKMYYPDARVLHISEFIAAAVRQRHGA